MTSPMAAVGVWGARRRFARGLGGITGRRSRKSRHPDLQRINSLRVV